MSTSDKRHSATMLLLQSMILLGIMLVGNIESSLAVVHTETAETAERWNWMEPKFSPNGGITAQIVKAVEQTKSTILVQAYNFTSKPIANALVVAKKRGVRIWIILDRSVPE